jgi:replication factor A1
MIEAHVQRIKERFQNAGYQIDENEIERRLRILLEEYKVPVDEAVRSVTNYFLKEFKITSLDLQRQRESPVINIKDIGQPNQWISVKGKVVQLWESESPKISQVGLIGDETGTIKFVIWSSSGQPPVEESKSYIFRNVVSDSFLERMQINVNKNSEIEPIEEDIEVTSSKLDVRGALVAIQPNSGLILRCPSCNRAIWKNKCTEHGDVEGKYDLRVKGVLDDGSHVYEVLLNEENLKSLIRIDVSQAKKMAEENLDRGAVLDYIRGKMLGRYFNVKGTRVGRYFLVEEISFVDKIDPDEIKNLLEAI